MGPQTVPAHQNQCAESVGHRCCMQHVLCASPTLYMQHKCWTRAGACCKQCIGLDGVHVLHVVPCWTSPLCWLQGQSMHQPCALELAYRTNLGQYLMQCMPCDSYVCNLWSKTRLHYTQCIGLVRAPVQHVGPVSGLNPACRLAPYPSSGPLGEMGLIPPL